MFNPFTGKPDDSKSFKAAELGLEPPRYCTECGRRMIVQVSPDGWWAKCSRHGVTDSHDVERQR